MNYRNFNHSKMAEKMASVPAAKIYNSFPTLVRFLDKSGYNAYEAEAILLSDWPAKAIKEFGCGAGGGKGNTGTLKAYLTRIGAEPSSRKVSDIVIKFFKESDHLELNSKGIPCRRGTMPGNPTGGTILVPVGTPISCDPTSETYWSS